MPATYGGWAGRSHGWRYLAQRIDGSGVPGIWLNNELPLHDVSFTDVLSGPIQLTATIPSAYTEMRAEDGQPLLDEWRTAIYAECDGTIRAGTIYVAGGFKSGEWNLDCSGFTTMMNGMGYPSAIEFRVIDPLDIVRHIWSITQMDPDSNLGMVIDPNTTTPVRVGQPLVVVVPDAAGGSGTAIGEAESVDDKAVELNWWSTHDLGGVIDGLARDAPFSYHERHQWDATQTQVKHFLDFGYPTLGRRRENLRFVVGENIQQELEPDRDGDEFANEAVVLGAGEGSSMIRASARVRDGRVRRQVTVDDKSIESVAHAQRVARLELAFRQQITKIKSVVVRNHPMAPIGSFGVGDEIFVQGMTDWMDLGVWCQVLSLTITPENPDLMSMSVMSIEVFTYPPPPLVTTGLIDRGTVDTSTVGS